MAANRSGFHARGRHGGGVDANPGRVEIHARVVSFRVREWRAEEETWTSVRGEFGAATPNSEL
jgi:hypothetical protein